MLNSLNQIGQKLTSLFGGKTELENPFLGNPLAHVLPWEAYDEEHGLFINQNSQGFTIESIPLVGSSHAIEKEIASIFQEILEEGESIQCLLWADSRTLPFLDRWEQARKEAPEIYQEIAKRRSEHFQKKGTRLFRCIFSYTRQGTEDFHRLKEKKEKILKTLKGLTYAFSWNVEDFLETVGAFLSVTPDISVQKRHWNPLQTLSSQLPTGGTLTLTEDHLSWDSNLHLKTYRAVDYPPVWSLSGMQTLIGDAFRENFRIEAPFYLHYGVHCPSQSKEETKFKQRSLFLNKQGQSGFLLRLIPSLKEELQEADAIRTELSQGEKFVWTQFSAGIWAPEEKISDAEQALKSLFRLNQFTLSENRSLHLPAYLSSLPMTWGEYISDLKELNLLKSTITSECSALTPLQGEWMGTSTPGMLLLGRRSQLVNWNPFDNKSGNYNIVVVGRSGSGKSVFMQDLLLSGLGTGAKVYVLEVGRSFEKLCELLGGQHLAFSKNSNICLNPFFQISQVNEEERDLSISFLKSILSTMAAPGKGTSDYENALLEKAIRYALDQENASITDVSHWLCSQKEETANVLGVMLTPYTSQGVYAKYFEGSSNVDFTSPMVLIELEELKEQKDLQAVVIQLFIMHITNQAFLGDRKTPFYLCIDEAWDLLRGKQTGVFIETLARRLRKYNGSLVIGTQSLDDFYATPGALAAYENSDWMCLLAQKKSSISRFSENKRIELDETKKRALESVTTRHGEYSEVMISDAEGNYSIQRLILDPFSQFLYTTKAQEYAQIKELQKEGMSLSQAIQRLVNREKA